jgi:hypothetical protein
MRFFPKHFAGMTNFWHLGFINDAIGKWGPYCQDKNPTNFLKEIIRILEKMKGVDYCAEKMLPFK